MDATDVIIVIAGVADAMPDQQAGEAPRPILVALMLLPAHPALVLAACHGYLPDEPKPFSPRSLSSSSSAQAGARAMAQRSMIS